MSRSKELRHLLRQRKKSRSLALLPYVRDLNKRLSSLYPSLRRAVSLAVSCPVIKLCYPIDFGTTLVIYCHRSSDGFVVPIIAYYDTYRGRYMIRDIDWSKIVSLK